MATEPMSPEESPDQPTEYQFSDAPIAPLPTQAQTGSDSRGDAPAESSGGGPTEAAPQTAAYGTGDPDATYRDSNTSESAESEPPKSYETVPLTPAEVTPTLPRPATPSGSGGPTPGSAGSVRNWDTLDQSGELQPGQIVFGRYMVQRLLGKGGMGQVWLVRHRELDIDRALKLIVARIAFDDHARVRFRREAQVMAKFSHHPNAVTVHDARLGEQDVAFIEMEYVQGTPLDRLLVKGQPMPLDWAARVLEQLCDALQEAHDQGIIHRDLKPSNLMLVDGRAEGRELLKVLDFGIAKVLGADESPDEFKTMTGQFMGTPPYASPEQANGRAEARSDIYSVGVILYEVLTGYRPFRGPAGAMMAQTQMSPPPPFATINPQAKIPPEIEAVVMRCLAKKAEDRPQSARELLVEFRKALPYQPDAAPVVTIVAPPRRAPWISIALAAAVLAAALVIPRFWPVTNTGGGGLKPPPKTVLFAPSGYKASESGAAFRGAFPHVLVRDDGSEYVLLEGGKFTMDPVSNPREVEVEPYYLQRTEVTNGQFKTYLKTMKKVGPPGFEEAYQKLLDEKLRPEQADKHPAVGITHQDAEDYAKWAGGRLPTEAEWEFAARSGGKDSRPYVWPNDERPLKDNDERAHIGNLVAADTSTLAVPTHPTTDVTEQGIYDLTGNVREWCADAAKSRDGDFSVRGGSWNSNADQFNTSANSFLLGRDSVADLGFRIAVDLPKKVGQ